MHRNNDNGANFRIKKKDVQSFFSTDILLRKACSRRVASTVSRSKEERHATN